MIFTNTEFTGHWPVGCAAVVEADSADQAAMLLMLELEKVGLGQSVSAFDMQRFITREEVSCNTATGVIILNDGNY